jgi:hypothetical protein
VAEYLLAEGTDELLLGDLTELLMEHAGDEQAFLTAAVERVTVEDENHELFGPA